MDSLYLITIQPLINYYYKIHHFTLVCGSLVPVQGGKPKMSPAEFESQVQDGMKSSE